jgi:peptide/nickel transport system ATP-binding protein
MTAPLLEITGLGISFRTEEGDIRAIRDVSLTVQRGRVTAVVGESGSGKSVTALAILRLLSPNASYTSGSIRFHDGDGIHDLVNLPVEDMRKLRGNRISMIFQEPMTSLNPLARCGQQVAEALMLHRGLGRKEAMNRAGELFRQVRLPDPEGMLKRYPHQLSGGQKQRVMIAMAMSCGPALLIADEPTTALDVTVQKTILELIRELVADYEMGVIFISHDLGLVSMIADDVVVMYQGEVVEKGPVQQVLRDPRHPYTRALLACRPIAHPKGARLPTAADMIGNAGPYLPLPIPSVRAAGEREVLMNVKDLRVWYPGRKGLTGSTGDPVRAVDDVSFEVFSGETLGLVGESGCGKTTLGRALLRLVHPTSGQILFRGKDLAQWPEAALRPLRKHMQIIFQDPYSSLNPRLPVGSAISEAMRVHGKGSGERQRRDMAVAWLEKVGLRADHYARYPHEFSGGQRQRIGIARALALDPGFVVCDESVSALDVSVQAQVLNLLADLKTEMGFTTVFISHDLGVVHHVSDRIMVMNRGRIEEIGYAEEVFNHPATAYTRTLLEAIPGRNGKR